MIKKTTSKQRKQTEIQVDGKTDTETHRDTVCILYIYVDLDFFSSSYFYIDNRTMTCYCFKENYRQLISKGTVILNGLFYYCLKCPAQIR